MEEEDRRPLNIEQARKRTTGKESGMAEEGETREMETWGYIRHETARGAECKHGTEPCR